VFVAGLGSKHIFGVFRVQRTCLVAVNVIPPQLGELNSASGKSLSWILGATLRWGKEGKWMEGRGKGKEGKRWVKNTPDGDGVCGW